MCVFIFILIQNIFFYSLIFNKKLISFINEMCMKMFFAIVNSTEKSDLFSENSKNLYLLSSIYFISNVNYYVLESSLNFIMDEHQCLNISSKCCFLLTAVRGMHSDPSLPNKHLLKEYGYLKHKFNIIY